jgi:hypothetical protein
MNVISEIYAPQAWCVMIGPLNPPTYPEKVFYEANCLKDAPCFPIS